MTQPNPQNSSPDGFWQQLKSAWDALCRKLDLWLKNVPDHPPLDSETPNEEQVPSIPSVEELLPADKKNQLQQQFEARQAERLRRQQKLQADSERAREQEFTLEPEMIPVEAILPEVNINDEEETEPAVPTIIQPSEAVAEENSVGGAIYQLEKAYQLPAPALLDTVASNSEIAAEVIIEQQNKLQDTLDAFSIDAQVIGYVVGPRVTLFQVEPASGVKVETITAISNNIAMSLCAVSLRILAPVPGRNFVGIEVPNPEASIVSIRSQLTAEAWTDYEGGIPLVLGKNINGDDMVLDLNKAPHLLIAGATGSGKSVCLNAMLLSMLYRFSPEELRLVLVDPKVVEFTPFKELPHLVTPVISDTSQVCGVLDWTIREMEQRYQILAKAGVRNIASYNSRTIEPTTEDEEPLPARLPWLVVVIDELADIMMTARADVEVQLARIAQLSRAVGIHTIIATQRPSVNVITGIIKANFPTRIAFQVTSQVDSRTILDSKGAESLLGRGDMLFSPPGASGMMRIQAPLVSDPEIERITEFISEQAQPKFDPTAVAHLERKSQEAQAADLPTAPGADLSAEDEALIERAIEVILRDQRASTSYVQRSLRIGYNRAAFIMDVLEDRGIVGPQIGASPREIFYQ